jgi:enoyl-[acyl-carrier-protein] reductase (NADH)
MAQTFAATLHSRSRLISKASHQAFISSNGAIAQNRNDIAACGIDHFDELLDSVHERTPANRLVTIDQIGRVAAFLANEAGAPLTGSITHADQGFHVIAQRAQRQDSSRHACRGNERR